MFVMRTSAIQSPPPPTPYWRYWRVSRRYYMVLFTTTVQWQTEVEVRCFTAEQILPPLPPQPHSGAGLSASSGQAGLVGEGSMTCNSEGRALSGPAHCWHCQCEPALLALLNWIKTSAAPAGRASADTGGLSPTTTTTSHPANISSLVVQTCGQSGAIQRIQLYCNLKLFTVFKIPTYFPDVLR